MFERVAHNSAMLWLKDECRSESNSARSASERIDPCPLEPFLHDDTLMISTYIETKECTITSDVSKESLLSFNISEFNFEERTRVKNQFHELLFMNSSPKCTELEQLDRIDSRLEIIMLSNIVTGEESTENATKSNNIWPFFKVPVVMAP